MRYASFLFSPALNKPMLRSALPTSLLPALASALLLAACASQHPAPVEDRSIPSASRSAPTVAEARPGYYTVKKGDTLYSIALDNGQNYRDIAAWNNLDNPNLIKVGQSLRVAAPEEGSVVTKPVRMNDGEDVRPVVAPPAAAKPTSIDSLKREPKGGTLAYSEAAWAAAQGAPAAPAATVATAPSATPAVAAASVAAPAAKPETEAKPASDEITDWTWPTSGKVGTPFAEGSSKGIDIPAKAGQPVVAASGGTVTLVSNALRGYGNLVVIKHNQNLLSVYAHNSKVLVSEGQAVSKGQKIAEVGNSDTDSPKLHFEIRRMGKPVDPLKFLPPN